MAIFCASRCFLLGYVDLTMYSVPVIAPDCDSDDCWLIHPCYVRKKSISVVRVTVYNTWGLGLGL